MKKRKRSRITVVYLGKVEYCGSYKAALARMDELTKDKPSSLKVQVFIDGELSAECRPLIIDGVKVDL
jgi:hypothetical protein